MKKQLLLVISIITLLFSASGQNGMIVPLNAPLRHAEEDTTKHAIDISLGAWYFPEGRGYVFPSQEQPWPLYAMEWSMRIDRLHIWARPESDWPILRYFAGGMGYRFPLGSIFMLEGGLKYATLLERPINPLPTRGIVKYYSGSITWSIALRDADIHLGYEYGWFDSHQLVIINQIGYHHRVEETQDDISFVSIRIASLPDLSFEWMMHGEVCANCTAVTLDMSLMYRVTRNPDLLLGSHAGYVRDISGAGIGFIALGMKYQMR